MLRMLPGVEVENQILVGYITGRKRYLKRKANLRNKMNQEEMQPTVYMSQLITISIISRIKCTIQGWIIKEIRPTTYIILPTLIKLYRPRMVYITIIYTNHSDSILLAVNAFL